MVTKVKSFELQLYIKNRGEENIINKYCIQCPLIEDIKLTLHSIRRCCFWKLLRALRRWIPRILSCCHCIGGEEKKWLMGPWGYSMILCTIIHRIPEGQWWWISEPCYLSLCYGEKKKKGLLLFGSPGDIIASCCNQVYQAMCCLRITHSWAQANLYSFSKYLLSTTTELVSRINWQTRQTESLLSRMLSIRRQTEWKAVEFISGSTDWDRKIETGTLIPHPSHFHLLSAPSLTLPPIMEYQNKCWVARRKLSMLNISGFSFE